MPVVVNLSTIRQWATDGVIDVVCNWFQANDQKQVSDFLSANAGYTAQQVYWALTQKPEFAMLPTQDSELWVSSIDKLFGV